MDIPRSQTSESHPSEERNVNYTYIPSIYGLKQLVKYGVSQEDANKMSLLRVSCHDECFKNGYGKLLYHIGRIIVPFNTKHNYKINDNDMAFWKCENTNITITMIKPQNHNFVTSKIFSKTGTHNSNMNVIVKETIPMLMWSEIELFPEIVNNNYKDTLERLYQLVDDSQIVKLGADTREKVKFWIDDNRYSSIHSIRSLNDKRSIAIELDKCFNRETHIIDRDNILPIIKNTCANYFGLFPDKYTPADIIMIKRDYIDRVIVDVENIIATKNSELETAKLLNEYIFNITNGPIHLISLKEENPLHGKGKSYIKMQTDNHSEFNITEEDELIGYQDMINKVDCIKDSLLAKKQDIGFKFKYKEDVINDYLRIYANLKILNFLLDLGSQEIINTALFAGGLFAGKKDIIPMFIKLIGRSKGECKASIVKENQNVTLNGRLEVEVNMYQKGNVYIFIPMLINNQPKIFKLNIRSNGSYQSTIELNTM
jgi:hypothetical protein